jgi:sialate O-acetylesterase
MIIERGLFDNVVLQRNKDNVSQAEFHGTSNQEGVLEAYVSLNNQPLDNFYPLEIGNIKDGKIQGVITGLMVGGSYEIKLTVEDSSKNVLDSVIIHNVLVGDVWILAGQSNMEGIGHLRHGLEPIPMVHAFYMNDTWDIAKDPIHVLADAIDQVHEDICGGVKPEKSTITGVGPGLSYAQEMHKITKIPQGVIACAHGGTSMFQWDPKLKELGSKSLYGAMYRRFVKNGSKVAGVLWYQGCNDANPHDAPLYTNRMKELVESIRKDFNNDTLPFVAVQLSRVCYPPAAGNDWNMIREQQRRLSDEISNLLVVPTIDLEMEDFIHISGQDQNRLGVRLAKAMITLTDKKTDMTPPITLKDIKIEIDEITNMNNVVITYDNVIGNLVSEGRPSGFELTSKPGEITAHYIFSTELKGNRVILRAGQNRIDTENFFLYYGFGVQPYCNITDQSDRSLPAMGHVRVGKARAMSRYALKAMISNILPSVKKLEGLEYPRDLNSLIFSERKYGYMYLDVHDLMAKASLDDGYLYYRLNFECDENMNLNVFLGYDGPVKMWIDKEVIFNDPNGTRPANVDDSITPYNANQGEHEILVALGLNEGKAGGIFLCFERVDVSSEEIEKGPGNYKVPKFI